MRFYIPEYCPSGGFIKTNNLVKGLNQYSIMIKNFYVVGEKPLFNYALSINKNIVCNQMLIEKPTDLEVNEQIVELKIDRSHISNENHCCENAIK